MCSKFFLTVFLFLTACTLDTSQDDCTEYYKLYNEDEGWFVYNLNKAEKFNRLVTESRKPEYVFTGDSIIDRWNVLNQYNGGYNWMTDEQITNVVNTGIYGHTICDMIETQYYRISIFEPKYIIADGGGNDIVFGVPTEIIMKFANSYIHSLRNSNKGAKIIFILIPPSNVEIGNKEKGEVNDQIKSSIQDIGNACYIGMDDAIAEQGVEGNETKAEFYGDKIHFNFHAYPILKGRVDIALNNSIGNGVFCYD